MIDLHLELGAGRTRRRALQEALRAAIREGRLPPRGRLPSSRELAVELGVARNTVAEAYAQLAAEGWLEARVGAGTRVASQPPSRVRSISPAGPAGRAARSSLKPGVPDLSAFPRTEWLRALRRALAAAPSRRFGYEDPAGLPELRAAVAGYAGRARGVVTSPDQVVICSGMAQALWLVCRAAGGRSLVTESHGLRRNVRVAADAGMRVTYAPVDRFGVRVDGLGAASMALLTPAHQFPLGVALEAGRRRQAAAWGRLILEDDYDGEFRFDRQPVGALQALAPDRIVYCGTASKALAPGLRLAWIAAPAALAREVVALKSALGFLTSVTDQLALAALIESGEYDRQIRRMRAEFRRRRDHLVQALDGLPVAVDGIAAGLHALVRLPEGVTEAAAERAALERGLLVEGLAEYRLDPAAEAPASLVVGYATPPGHTFTSAVARLRAALAAL